MAKNRRMAEKFPDVEGRMTKDGWRRASNFITDILRGRKDAVTFYRDSEGVLRELGTGKDIEVVYQNTTK